MQVTVTFRHMDPTDALKDFAEEKLARIQKLHDGPLDANVVLSTEKFHHVAEITASVRGGTFNGTERTEDMYVSIDRAVEKLERQIVKFKEKLQKR